MTSLAVLPTLKRTITDIMEEDLYHLPNSPIQFSTNQPSQNHFLHSQQHSQQHMLRSDSPNPFLKNASVSSSPAMNHTQLFSNNTNNAMNMNMNNNNLSSLLNIPDSFMEHYTKNNGSSNNLGIDPMKINGDFYNNSNLNNQTNINPFNAYGNPDTQINSYYQQNDNQKPYPFNRRRRITTLDTSDGLEKNLKDEDYLLFNPDIQPSHLFSNKLDDDYAGSSLFVPNKTSEFTHQPIPGYENDYLLVGDYDDFDEEVEEDLSEDEDDNYFYDNGEFDDLIMNDNTFMDMDNDLKSTDRKENEMNIGNYVDEYDSNEINADNGINDIDNFDNAMTIDDLEINDPSPSEFSEESISPIPAKITDDSEYHSHTKTPAEITANNPNHQCDLVNPSTGQPCNKQFSRPYDLIRHQETIHASKKKIFRCVICEGRLNGGAGNGKLKTFSRGDALSRHIKVKHGLVGKDAIDLINDAKENVEYVYV